MCLPDSIYDLIIGNIPLTRPADKPNPIWRVASCKAQPGKNCNIVNCSDDRKFCQKEDNKQEDKRITIIRKYIIIHKIKIK